MKEGQSKSTQPRRNPVPSRPTRRPKDPRKLLRGGSGGGGAALLPLAKRVSLEGGRPWFLGGFIGRETLDGRHGALQHRFRALL